MRYGFSDIDSVVEVLCVTPELLHLGHHGAASGLPSNDHDPRSNATCATGPNFCASYDETIVSNRYNRTATKYASYDHGQPGL